MIHPERKTTSSHEGFFTHAADESAFRRFFLPVIYRVWTTGQLDNSFAGPSSTLPKRRHFEANSKDYSEFLKVGESNPFVTK
jgi:hypothetical protein